MHEVACKDAGRRGFQELPPRRRRSPRRGAETGGGQDPADRPLPHPVPQAGQLALDAPVPPRRVLPSQLLHEGEQRVGDVRLDGAVVAGGAAWRGRQADVQFGGVFTAAVAHAAQPGGQSPEARASPRGPGSRTGSGRPG